jgi:transcriptional regulator with XRE-family HTH domain
VAIVSQQLLGVARIITYSAQMSIIENDPTQGIADRIRLERERRGWSLANLGSRAGVSKTMISKIERGAASPTAALLGRLSGAFGLTLSTLLARAEGGGSRLVRAADQPLWTDPGSGYVRRQVSPLSDIPLELIQVELPAGAEVPFPAASYAFIRQMVWVIHSPDGLGARWHAHLQRRRDHARAGPRRLPRARASGRLRLPQPTPQAMQVCGRRATAGVS